MRSTKVSLLSCVTAGLALALATPAGAAEPTPDQLAQALGAYGQGSVAPADLRAIACEGSAEAPTEFSCRWQQRTGRGWSGYSTWLATGSDGWTVLDDPLHEPDPDTGRLKGPDPAR